MFGKLVGAGQAGFVFEKASNPDHYYKIVALGDQPLSEYGLKSTKAKMYAINRNQARLFYQLSKKDLGIAELPEIYSFYTGTVVPKLRQNFLRNNDYDNPNLTKLLSALPVGQKIAVWEMEKIPCLSENDYCNRYQELPPRQNQSYQNLLNKLLDLGFVVRDVANPENFGYRDDGTQVFFDPIVADWPTYQSDKVLQPVRYDSFVASFGKDQLQTVARSISNKDYFTWYHGGGVMEAESSDDDSIPLLDTKKLYDVWFNESVWDNMQYPALRTFNWFSPDYNKAARVAAYSFWETYYQWLSKKIEQVIEGVIETSYEDEEIQDSLGGWYGNLTPTNVVSITYELLQETDYEEYDDEISELIHADNQYHIFFGNNVIPSNPVTTLEVFIQARDSQFSTLLNSISFSVSCQSCGGSGTKSDDRDNDYYCGDCEGEGKHEAHTGWNSYEINQRRKTI